MNKKKSGLIFTAIIAVFFVTNSSASQGPDYIGYVNDTPMKSEYERMINSGSYMNTKGITIKNPYVALCRSLTDCRDKGYELNWISKFNGTDYSDSYYPQSRYVPGTNGYYIFLPSKR